MNHFKFLLAVGSLAVASCTRDSSIKETTSHDKAGDPPVPDGDKVGRFVIQGHKFGDKQVLMRLDTCTGKVWVYENFHGTTVEGDLWDGWDETFEPAEVQRITERVYKSGEENKDRLK